MSKKKTTFMVENVMFKYLLPTLIYLVAFALIPMMLFFVGLPVLNAFFLQDYWATAVNINASALEDIDFIKASLVHLSVYALPLFFVDFFITWLYIKGLSRFLIWYRFKRSEAVMRINEGKDKISKAGDCEC